MDFNFVRNEKIKKIIIRDYAELQKLAENNITKATIVISGGILESLLIDALVFARELDFNLAVQKKLVDLINLAKSKRIIREDVLSHAIRDYRNLIHAGKEIKQNVTFDVADADLSLSAIKIVLRDLKKWYEKAIPVFLASAVELEFLELFTMPEPNNIDYSTMRPWIKNEVFQAGQGLASKNVLIAEELKENIPKFKFDLTPGVSDLIDKITGKKVKRETLVVALREVFANNTSGSGATGSINRY